MPTAVTAISATRLATIMAGVQERVEEQKISESERLKRINDEKAAKKAALQEQRRAKEQARLDKLAAEEAARIEIDRQEEQFRQAERRREVEAANLKLWEQSERVRELRGRMLLSEVLAERGLQIALRVHLEGLEAAERERFHARLLERIKAEEAAEAVKAAGMRSKAVQLRAMQDEQLNELRESILREREAKRVEGLRLREAALQDAEDAKTQAILARLKAVEAEEATRDANAALLQLKAQEREKDRLADIAIEEYARKQEGIQDARRAERTAKQAEKEARRQAMVDLMERTYLSFLKEPDEKLTADVAATDANAAAEAARKLQKQKDDWAATDKSRQAQLAEKRERKTAEKAAEAAFARAWVTQLEDLQEEEAAEVKAIRQKHKEYVAFLQRQIDLKEAAKLASMANDMEEDAVRLWAMANKDAMFDKYAEVCVEEWKARHRDTKPLQLYLASAAKPYLAPSI